MDHNCALDGSDTGLGKTYSTLKVCKELQLRPIIICKLAGMQNWKVACKYMGVEPLAIVNWEFAKGGKLPYVHRDKDEWDGNVFYSWGIPSNAIILFDEAHVAAVRGSQNYALYTASVGCTSITISATLTDRPARFDGFFNVLKVLDKTSFDHWLKSRTFQNLKDEPESVTDIDDMKEINSMLYPYHGYRLAYGDADVKKYFPEVVFQTHILNLSEASTNRQNQLYQELLVKINQYRELKHQADVLVADLRYRQETELLKAPELVDVAQDLLCQGKSVCIFVNFRDTLRYLSRALKTNSLIYGQQERDKINREAVLNAFQENKTRLIICMADAGGQSINLHDLDGRHQRFSLVCPTYNPLTLKQIMGRTYRANVKSIPVIKLIYAANTIEEKVAQTVGLKLRNISALNDGDLMEPDIFNQGFVHPDSPDIDDQPTQI